MAGTEIWDWLDYVIENGHSTTIGDARDPLDILIEIEEDQIIETGYNLKGWKIK